MVAFQRTTSERDKLYCGVNMRIGLLFSYPGGKTDVGRSDGGGSHRTATFLCRHLSHSSGLRNRDCDVNGRGGLLAGITGRGNCAGLIRFLSSNVSNIAVGHPNFIRVVRRLRRKGTSTIFIGSLSHLNQGCVRIKQLARRFFPSRSVQLITISSGVSATRKRGRLTPVQGLFGR